MEKKKKKASCRTNPTPLTTQPYVGREGIGKAGFQRLAHRSRTIDFIGHKAGNYWKVFEPGRDKIRFAFLTSDSRCSVEKRHGGIRREGMEADKKEFLGLL